MNIIVEGMDRCGKSTLIEWLRDTYNRSFVVHSGIPPKSAASPFDWEMMYYYNLAETANDSALDVIFDRFHLGVHVYGTEYRGYDDDQVQELFDVVEGSLLESNTYLITLVDYGSEIFKREDGLSFESTVEHYDATRVRFIEAHAKSELKKLLINVTDNGGFLKTFSTVKEFIDGN